MARISKSEHAAIRTKVDVEGRRVADVAAEYGCTPANIYNILRSARAEGGSDAAPTAVDAPTAEPAAQFLPASPPSADAPLAGDLFGSPAQVSVEPQAEAAVSAPARPALPAAVRPPSVTAPSRGRAAPAPPPRPARGGGSGYALLMRAGDGEEAVHPFRSLEELLASAKPILRNAARSPEPVWFSIQPVDLDALADQDL